MDKAQLIIKNVDFSTIAIDDTPAPTPTGHNYPGTFMLETGGGNPRIVYNTTIPVGKKVGIDTGYGTYKYAINIGSALFPGNATWDTGYTGAAYLQQNVTIARQAIQIMVTTVEGNPTSSDVTYINAHFYVDD